MVHIDGITRAVKPVSLEQEHAARSHYPIMPVSMTQLQSLLYLAMFR